MNINIITQRRKNMNSKESQDYKSDYKDMLKANSYLSKRIDFLLKEQNKLQHEIDVLKSHKDESDGKRERCFSVYLELGYTSFVYLNDEGKDISSMHEEATEIAKKELAELISKNGVDLFTVDTEIHEMVED